MSLQYVIDGYNLINHPLFRRTHKSKPHPQSSLLAFIRIKRLTGSPKNKITVVFDGFPAPRGEGGEDAHISVIFSRKISADEKIKRIIEESGERKNIVVVSDDKEIKFMVKLLGAQSIGIEEFVLAKEKLKLRQEREPVKPELNYSQMHKINEELRRLWLK